MSQNGKPVVALDIDGTLGDYHAHFLRFAAEWYGREMPAPDTINPGMPLHRFMRTSKRTYRECKLAYRQGGIERSMPVFPGAAELTRAIRKVGVELWLCTTRPYLKLDTQAPNTTHWLRRNKITYDYMLSGPHKYRDLAKQVGTKRIVCVMDDLPEMVTQATSLGMDGVIRDQPYNKHFSWHLRAMDMYDAQEGIMRLLKIWRDKNG